MKRYLPLLILTLLVLLGGFFRFTHLSWGEPYFFHPDERNVASSISQLHFPEQMNPKFFAYGSLPIYTVYFLGLAQNFIQSLRDGQFSTTVTFEQAILTLRFLSATFSTLLIPLLYLLGTRLKDTRTGIIASILATLSVGFIQFAHFGTFELWLTFFSVLYFFLTLSFWQKKHKWYWVGISVTGGILLATKVSMLPLLPLAFIPLIVTKHSILQKLLYSVLFLLVVSLVYLLTNPFAFLDFQSFSNSINYESSLALGKLLVFYTGEFLSSTPVLFPLLRIYPFLLNPLLTLLLIPAVVSVLIVALRQKHISYLFLLGFGAALFLMQAVLFVQWTRYYMPTMPFFLLIIALFLTSISDYLFKRFPHAGRLYFLSGFLLLVAISSVFTLSFVKTVYFTKDTRLQALDFAKNHIPSGSPILSEVYDLGIVPFNTDYQSITLFNTYDLDNNSPEHTEQTFREALQSNDYVILPSQRVFKTRLSDPDHFPIGHKLYRGLFSGALGYKLIYQTPCDIFCQITYLGDPVYSFEQTANIFDRPTVMIYKKL